MQKHRILSLASILAMLLIPALGWLLVAQPQLDAAAAADQQRADTEAQIQLSQAVVDQLKKDSQKLPELNHELDQLRTSIPFDADASGYLDGLDALAQFAHVDITGLTVADGLAYVPATPPGGAEVATDAAATEEAGASTPEPASDPAIVTSPLIDSSNFVAIPVTVQVAGEWAEVLKFVQGVQSSPRLFLVSSLSTSVDKGSSSYTATIGGYIYAIPSGVPGNPKPISTTVKQLGPVQPPAEDEADAAADGDAPTPDATETPAP